MEFLVFLLVVGLVFFMVYLYFRYNLKHKTETITAYTGGLGSGKSLLSSQLALKLYRKNLRKWYTKNLLNKILKKPLNTEKPQLYSSIPLKIGKGKYSQELTNDILLLQTRIPLKSVVFIDEIGAFANQFEYNNPNIKDTFDEFVRFFRHYTQGGYMVVNDQCSENIVLTIRRRLNKVHNLSNCVVIWRFVFYFERMINISEEIKTIDEVQDSKNQSDTQDNMALRFMFLWNNKIYDTYCYSNRYKFLVPNDNNRYLNLKKDSLLKCPDKSNIYVNKIEQKRKEDSQ